MGGRPVEARRTLAWDQGSEMACHDKLAGHFAEGVFFAYPGRPWERPLNENTNGLLRQYFPKRTCRAAPQRTTTEGARLADTG